MYIRFVGWTTLILKSAVARAESSQGLGIMTAYRCGPDHLFGYAPAALRRPDPQAVGESSARSTAVFRLVDLLLMD